MYSVVSISAFANVSNVPTAVFVDLRQEHVAAPRLPAISAVERSTDSCRKVSAAASSAPSTLIDAFHRNHKVTYPCDASASHELEESDARITSTTLPCKLEIGKNAGG